MTKELPQIGTELTPEEWDELEAEAELTEYQRGIIREARNNAVTLRDHAKRIERLEHAVGLRADRRTGGADRPAN